MARFYIPIIKGKKQLPDFSQVTSISGNRTLYDMFIACDYLKGEIIFSNLTTVSGTYAFENTFFGCSGLTNISFPKLTSITGTSSFYYAFYRCSGLTNISFPKLATITGNSSFQYAFYSCTSLKSLSFPALTSNSFGSYTNQFYRMLQGVTGCAVHFPSNLQSVIGSWSDVTSGFGGTNTTVLFDLLATS